MKCSRIIADESGFVTAVREAQRSADFLRELEAVLAEADSAVAPAAVVCRKCGKCCDFERMDHRVFASTGELALLSASPAPKTPEPPHCPYQLDLLCSAHDRRCLGCRLFFCESDATSSDNDSYKNYEVYEKFHRRIIALHRRSGVAYFYTELTAALAMLAAE